MYNDLHNNISPVRALSPAAAITDNTAQVCEVVDHSGYGSAEYIILTGSIADADVTTTVLLEESDASGSGFSAVSDNDLIGTEALAAPDFADDDSVLRLGYRGSKRYTRMTITPANNTGNIFLAVTCVRGNPKQAPTS